MFPVVEVKGTPYQCGRQYGQSVSNLIRKNIAAYMQLFKYHVGLDESQVEKRVKDYLTAIEDFDTDLIAEMQGIADGAEVPLVKIVALNARMELLANSPYRQGECTAFSVSPPASASSQTWLAQNWDWYQITEGLTVLLKIEENNRPRITTLVEAGQMAKMGINDQGIGLCVSQLLANYHQPGVSFIAICRSILKSSQLIDAIDSIYKPTRGTAANYLIAHRDGYAMDFEAAPNDIDFLEPEDGIIVHTNHLISQRLRKHDVGLKKRGGDSLVRRQRAKMILELERGNIDLQTIKRVQMDSSCAPYSICTFPAPDEPLQARWSTLAGIIMNLTTLEMYITKGKPIESEYYKLSPFD